MLPGLMYSRKKKWKYLKEVNREDSVKTFLDLIVLVSSTKEPELQYISTE